MIDFRNSIWSYDYMAFSRRIGEIWKPFCKLCFEHSNNQPQGRVLRYFLTFTLYSDTEIIPDVSLHVFSDNFQDFSPDFLYTAASLSHLHVLLPIATFLLKCAISSLSFFVSDTAILYPRLSNPSDSLLMPPFLRCQKSFSVSAGGPILCKLLRPYSPSPPLPPYNSPREVVSSAIPSLFPDNS